MTEKRGYKDLIVWQKAINLVVLVYKLTNSFPQAEVYGITAQLRRAAISIPSNIAEGSKRGTKKDFSHFLNITIGSGAELETQIEIAKKLKFGNQEDYKDVDYILSEIMKMLTTMIAKLKTNN
ncbi:MAG: four helix bundle protein [Candidatus Lloydbacteria bacterium RIFCSPHIGHO2_01_FULL_41_20]|uniref:Four helix bundle protein n=1 Tax=Candidatus Lloydbacteria bacterium RIFCSPHIGHO2_01_FULL_41_20 TaxID=1798657 RepID=A0A1G2CQU1_9BACT|nr:MAG: four helix bundle protein [Candidatus Lloydbacteria bacterium RIFCSPHIGHO2_01_FULL_41_20]